MLNKAPWLVLSLICLTACDGRIEPARPVVRIDPPSGLSRRVTFVQMTDPHLFDAGSARHAEGVEEEALDNRAALHWAVLETNRLVLSERQAVDFVVITGDFGLDNVTMPPMSGLPGGECPQRPAGKEGPVVAVPLGEAAAEVARALRALVVKKVFLVPGNNDLCQEHPDDLHRWAEFVDAVRTAVAAQTAARTQALAESYPSGAARAPDPPDVVDLTYSLERLHEKNHPRISALFTGRPAPARVPPAAPTVNGVSLLGLNSAFFKLEPKVAGQAQRREMDFVRARVGTGGSHVIFTHIPDLPDPHRGATTTPAKSPEDASSWRMSDEARKIWTELLDRSDVIGVFAGHFHASQRGLYPHDFGYAIPPVRAATAVKTWLAPPLAAKHQWTIPPAKAARGMLLVTVTVNGGVRVSPPGGDGVTQVPLWYSTSDQTAAVKDDEGLTKARAAEAAGHWEAAVKGYEDVLGSTDARARATAAEGYARARAITDSWWWEIGAVLRPLRWLGVYPARTIAFVPGLVFAGLLLLLAIGLLRFLRLFRFVGWATRRLAIPRYRGRTRLHQSTALTKGAPNEAFFALMLAAGAEIRDGLTREQEAWLAHHVSLLAPSSTSMGSMLTNMPSVGKVDVSQWVRFVLQVRDTLQWNVESGIAVFDADGAPAPVPGSTALPERGTVHAYAVLRWGWITKNRWARTVPYDNHRGQSTLEGLAHELSALVLGQAFVR